MTANQKNWLFHVKHPKAHSKPLSPMKGENSTILEDLLRGDDNKHFLFSVKGLELYQIEQSLLSIVEFCWIRNKSIVSALGFVSGKESQLVSHNAQKFFVRTSLLPLESCCSFGYCCRNCTTLIFFDFDNFSAISVCVEFYFVTKIVRRFERKVGFF